MKKWILLVALFYLFPYRVEAETEEMERMEEEMLDNLEIEEMQQLMDDLLKEDSMSIKATIRSMMNGEIPFSMEYFGKVMQEGLRNELSENKDVFGQVLLLALVSAVLASLIQVFDQNKIGDVCFYMIYMMIFVLLLKTFGQMSEYLQETLDAIVSLMQALVPAYYLVVTAAAGATSAMMFHQIVLIVIFCVEYLMSVILMPAIHIYVLMSLINLLTKEEVLSKITELLKSAILWVQKSMLAVIIGMQVIQSLIAPAVDSLKRSMLVKSVSVIPGVGNVVNGVTEIFFASAVLIRNCFGATALIVLLLLGIAPLLRLSVNVILYKVTGALLQPICDSRLVGCFLSMGEGCLLLLKLLFTTQVLFMLTIVILAKTL